MLRRLLIFSVGMAVIAIPSRIPIAAQPRDAHPSAAPKSESPGQKQGSGPDGDLNQSKTPVPAPDTRIATSAPPKADPLEREAYDWYEWQKPSVVTNVALVFVAIWAGGIALGTLKAIRAEVRATTKAAKAAADSVLEARKSGGIADRSAQAAADSAVAARDTLATNREIERIYVAMSYRQLLFLERKNMTTLRPERHDDHPDTVDVVVELRNVGRTPGTIVGGWCGFLYQPACEKPQLLPAMDSSTRLTRVFMLPNQMLDFAIQIPLTKSKVLFLRNGEPESGYGAVEGTHLPVADPMHLWLAGEIYYIDRFDSRHKAGYATRWDRLANRFHDPSVTKLGALCVLRGFFFVVRRPTTTPHRAHRSSRRALDAPGVC
jgi:hypothetical protein